MIIHESKSSQETELIGERIGSLLSAGAVVALDSSLGGGKTVIAKGIVKGALGLDPNLVTSPAFSLVNEYRVEDRSLTIYHMDFYRLESLTNEDFEMFKEYLDDEKGIVLAEWGSRFLPELCREYLVVELGYLAYGPEDTRSIRLGIYGEGSRYTSVLKGLQDYVDAHS